MSSADRSESRDTAAAHPGAGDQQDQRAGRDFLFALHAAMRALKLYPLENQAVQNALAELETVTGSILGREGALLLRYVGDFCFVNDLRLRVEMASYAAFGTVGRALHGHGVGQVEIDAPPPRPEWTALLTLLQREPDAEDPFGDLAGRLAAAGVEAIRVAPDAEVEERSGEVSRRAARETYAQSLAAAREAMVGVRLGRAVSVRKVKRAVQRVVDQVLNNESSIMGMAVLRDYDDYTFAHSVNVCIFSIALGKKLGFGKLELYELGMGALLHDIGKARLPIEITTKPGALDEPEWRMVREHPVEGLLSLLEMRAFGEIPLRTMLAAYEHHMKIDQTGYPRSRRPREPTLFSRIVAVADGFDAATSKRSYQEEPWLPDAVLREMRDNSARGLDPLLVKAFISMTGFYPIGSLVVLDTFELAVVVATSPEVPNRPTVRLIFDEMGLPIEPARTIDLAAQQPGGAPAPTIIKTTDPERYGIDIRRYFE